MNVQLVVADFALALLVEFGLAVGTVVGYMRTIASVVEEWGGHRQIHWRANNPPLKRVLDLANKSPAANPSKAAPWNVDLSAAARQYATTGHAATHFQDAESLCDAVDLGYFFLLRVSEFAASGDAAGAGPLARARRLLHLG